MSNSPIKIEISILNNTSNKNDVEDIVIWNYNGKDVNKGIKDIEVWKRHVIKRKGIVPKGAYNKKSDYSLFVVVALQLIFDFIPKNVYFLVVVSIDSSLDGFISPQFNDILYPS